jgi:ectoine hydroxylase-related dioxygenase (phytanoyl-CoA dioxygenase family)
MIAEQVERDGFAVVADVITATQIDSILTSLGNVARSRAGARHLLSNNTIHELSESSPLHTLATTILGMTAIPFRATLFDKSPGANWKVSWHQDTALPLRSWKDVAGWGPWSIKDGVHYAHAPTAALEQVVALRVHLDDSSHGNGPLRVLPGTHKHGVLTDDEVAEMAHRATATDCIAPSGSVLAMRPLLIHSSSKIANAEPRRVLHIEYAASLQLDTELELAIA